MTTEERIQECKVCSCDLENRPEEKLVKTGDQDITSERTLSTTIVFKSNPVVINFQFFQLYSRNKTVNIRARQPLLERKKKHKPNKIYIKKVDQILVYKLIDISLRKQANQIVIQICLHNHYQTSLKLNSNKWKYQM